MHLLAIQSSYFFFFLQNEMKRFHLETENEIINCNKMQEAKKSDAKIILNPLQTFQIYEPLLYVI